MRNLIDILKRRDYGIDRLSPDTVVMDFGSHEIMIWKTDGWTATWNAAYTKYPR